MLKVWLITSAICMIISIISAKAINNEMKRDGYIIKKIKFSISEKIRLLIYFCIPVYNIIITLVLLFMGKKIKEEGIKQGKYVKIEENVGE